MGLFDRIVGARHHPPLTGADRLAQVDEAPGLVAGNAGEHRRTPLLVIAVAILDFDQVLPEPGVVRLGQNQASDPLPSRKLESEPSVVAHERPSLLRNPERIRAPIERPLRRAVTLPAAERAAPLHAYANEQRIDLGWPRRPPADRGRSRRLGAHRRRAADACRILELVGVDGDSLVGPAGPESFRLAPSLGSVALHLVQ